MPLRRTLRIHLIFAGLCLGWIAGGFHPMAQGAPATGPSVEGVMAQIHTAFGDLADSIGGLNADEKTKLAAMESKIAAQLKADPAKMQSAEFERSVFSHFRDILSAEDQKKFDAMIIESRRRALQLKTVANLKQIGTLCFLYSGDNHGKSAADLGALTAQDAPPDLFLAAGSKTRAPADWKKLDAKAKAQWVNKNTDFVYLAGGQTDDLKQNFVVAYVKPELAPDGNCFLMGDGKVLSKSAEESKAILADLKGGKNPAPSLKVE